MSRVGWLGLGAMGLPMARRLIGASHDVTAFDPVPASRETLATAGGRPVSTAAEASEGAEDLVDGEGPSASADAAEDETDGGEDDGAHRNGTGDRGRG